jgi:hypothetical protein
MLSIDEDISSMLHVFNIIEAAFWLFLGMVFVRLGLKANGRKQRRCYLAALLFMLFAGTDIVELWTGAWWKPWWLFVWNGSCLVAFVLLAGSYWRERQMEQ